MRRTWLLTALFILASVNARAQGIAYSPGNALTYASTLSTPCADGNLIVLTATFGGFAPGTIHVCLSNVWTPIVPAAIAVSGTVLPSTCITGAIFTVTPAGALWTCASTNNFVPVGATAIIKTVTGLLNNTNTTILNITIPNISGGAIIELTISGSLGAGGAVGAFESTTGRSFLIALTRVAGAATVATISIGNLASPAVTVGASSLNLTASLGVVSGANSATQTIPVVLNLSRVSGASTNHTASMVSRIVSPAPTSITIN